MSDDHATLLAAIGRALGLPKPYAETVAGRLDAVALGTLASPPAGAGCEVLGGAVDAARGRVAWVEQRSEDAADDDYVPVEIDLRFAWDGELRAVVVPYTYNPYFGCDVHLARWYGDRFVLLYTEKHKTLLSHFDPPYEAQKSVGIGGSFIVDGDAVYWLDRSDAVLRGRMVATMTETGVLSVPGPAARRALWLEGPGVARVGAYPSVHEHESREEYAAAEARAMAAGVALDLRPTRR
ncbi:MAG: hypothetical protein JWM10_4735 [Myxococcaceae bacterium]|nr:hypothetical protein [Myxococcaceae bacterium]